PTPLLVPPFGMNRGDFLRGATVTDDDRFPLLFGPYAAPPCKVGAVLACRRFGRCTVARISAGTMPWPMCQRSRGWPSLILCSDLVRAVLRESASVVCSWWGVASSTLWRWRKLLGVPRSNLGTEKLYSQGMRDHKRQAKAPRAAPICGNSRRTPCLV